MAKDRSYQYLDLAKPILPYISYTTPVDETPRFIPGSKNVMASQIGYLEKRPGFSASMGNVQVGGLVERIFGWRRWNGSFFVMLSSTSGTTTNVMKQEIGVDSGFIVIWTSSSTIPFDFVVSNNFCFFGNEVDMRKYDGTQVTKWGVDPPAVQPPVTLESGGLPPGMTFSSPTFSGTPTSVGTTQLTFTATDVLGNTASKTFNFVVNASVLAITSISNLPNPGVGFGYTFNLAADYGTPPYTWSLFSGSLPVGMTLSSGGTISGTPSIAGPFAFAVQVTDSLGAKAIKSFSFYVTDPGGMSVSPASPLASGTVGTSYANSITVTGGTGPYTFGILPIDSPYPIGLGTLPPGLTIQANSPSVNITGTPTAPGVYRFNLLVLDSASHILIQTYTLQVDAVNITIVSQGMDEAVQGHAYSFTPSVTGGATPYTITLAAGTLDAQTGYVYGYTYTTIYGHESNMSPLSDSTGIFTGLDPTAILTASNDFQVNGINVYRTTDGGIADPAVMRLVAQLANLNQTFRDSTPDIFLGTQTGPGFLINTPPTPCRGFVWSNGRIYGMTKATTPYSGLEEVSNGIPEEAWPSGADGNYYNWPAQVGGMAVTDNGVDIALSEQYWQISGDSLDTFRKSLLLDKAGVGSPTCINAIGNSVQWVDSAKQIWSSTLGEVGEPIRSDITGLIPTRTYIGYHKSGNYNWLYVLDANVGILYIFDLDTNQWYPPWTIPATAIWSGETSVGVIDLLVAIGGTIYKFSPGTYNDAGNVYEDDLKMGLIPISPGRNTTARSKMQATQLEEVLFEQSATNYEGVLPSFMGVLCDDNPVDAAFEEWVNLTGNNTTPQFIPRRKHICQYRYICDSTTDPAIRVAAWVQFAPQQNPWRIYSLTLSWQKA